jgi:hypothetical protein
MGTGLVIFEGNWPGDFSGVMFILPGLVRVISAQNALSGLCNLVLASRRGQALSGTSRRGQDFTGHRGHGVRWLGVHCYRRRWVAATGTHRANE